MVCLGSSLLGMSYVTQKQHLIAGSARQEHQGGATWLVCSKISSTQIFKDFRFCGCENLITQLVNSHSKCRRPFVIPGSFRNSVSAKCSLNRQPKNQQIMQLEMDRPLELSDLLKVPQVDQRIQSSINCLCLECAGNTLVTRVVPKNLVPVSFWKARFIK